MEKVPFMFGQLEMEGFEETIAIVMGTHQIFTPSLLVRKRKIILKLLIFVYLLDIRFRQITTIIKVLVAFVFWLHIL